MTAAMETIVELEERLDRVLPAVRLEGRLPRAQAQSVADRPVFICGMHRSGTTLVRDRLDGHPALAVLPSEGSFFTNFHIRIARLRSTAAREWLGLIWLRRTANPINQPPYWLLGRSTAARSPYVEFARALLTLWSDLESAVGTRAASWPTAAIALAWAYVQGRGAFDPRLSRWAEKTPTNEQHLDRLWTEFPGARVIHVIRDPLSVVASRKLLETRATGTFANRGDALRDLVRSYRIAVERSSRQEPERYLLLRYEDVTLDPEATANRLARFLEIERLEELSSPTVGGEASASNTSYAPPAVRGQIAAAHDRRVATLTPLERDTVVAVAGRLAAALGYRLPAIGRWRSRYLRWRNGIW